MKKSNIKKIISLALIAAMAVTAFTGCKKENGDSGNSGSNAGGEKKKVLLWHLWTGDGEKNLNNAVAKYNEKSDKYVVESLSVPDMQKIMIAISSGDGPDITDDFASNVASYAEKSVMEPLDDYIKKSNMDLSDFIPAALNSCKYNGKQYAFPINMNLMALFYNKKILADNGIKEPPKTYSELLDMSIKTTKTNADGSIDVLGFPDFPAVYYLEAFVGSFGGSWYNEDGTASNATHEGNKMALDMAIAYRQKFGLDNIQKFSTSGKYLDPADPFLKGKQTFRIDGPWMGKSIREEFKITEDQLQYGVTYVPYADGKENLKGRTFTSSSMYYIPKTAKQKDGAWDFMQFIVSKEGQTEQTLKGGDFPCLKSLLDAPDFTKGGHDREFFRELATNKNIIANPNTSVAAEYMTIVNEETELALNLKKTSEEALKSIVERSKSLFKK